MARRPSLFARSPFARRMVLLFFGSALLPVATVAVMSYRSVERNLLEQARVGLQQESKMVGMGVVERLLSLEASLQFAGLQVLSAPSVELEGELGRIVARNLAARFDAVLLERPGGAGRAILGTLDAGPPLNGRELVHLANGRTLLRVSRTGSVNVDLTLVQELAPSRPGEGRLWARANPEYLWGLGARNTLPPRTELAVVDDAGGLVIRSEAIPPDFPRRFREATSGRDDRWLEWREGDQSYVAGSWKIPMQTNYLAGAWTVVLSESHHSLMRPVAAFRRDFPLLILATLWVVLLLSLSQIRRLLGPLAQLRLGTQRLARGEFGHPVKVDSHDELAELAEAFNSMAEQLSGQFDTLATMETVARSALAAGDRSTLIHGVLPRIRALLGCRRLDLLVIDPGDPEALRFSASADFDDDNALSESRITLSDLPGLDDLRLGRPRRVGDTGTPHAGAAIPGGHADGILYPLLAGGELIAVLVLVGGNAAEAALRVEGELAEQLAVILQQSQLRSALEAERRRLETLLEYLPSGVLLLDGEQRIALANRIARECLGVLSSATVGDRLENLGGRSIGELATFKVPVPHELVTGSGDPRVFQVVAGVVTSEDAPLSTVIVLREITRERQIEAQMQRQERLASVGQLAAGISHDFNNLLQGITMAAELLRLTTELPAPLRETSREIGREAQRGARLIRQILDFSRRTASSRTAVEVGQVVDETLELLRRTLPESLSVHFHRPSEELVVMADAVQLQQIVMNLAVNARDAMPEGGRLDLRVSGLEIEEFATRPVPEMRPGAWVRIEVADTGHGIPAEIGGKVFEPFFTTKAEGLGTGLGLAQVFGLVQQHGGHVDFTSRIGSGTVFHVYLPRVPLSQEAVLAGPSEDAIRGRGERVLVVENRSSLLDTTCRTLERLGFEATGVSTAAEALHLFEDMPTSFDGVLVDVVMPGMSGIELLRRLRQQRPELPVVLMSGYVSDDHLARLQALGGAQVLHKPFDAATVARALRRAIDDALSP